MRPVRGPTSPFKPRLSMLDWHDDWNLVALGVLNLAHVGWWCGIVSSSTALSTLFAADACYIIADTCWLLFFPTCVPAKVRGTLLIHHMLICFAIPVAAGKAVLMRHMLRTWMVELHSWTHIAQRRLRSERLCELARAVNKPLFFALRIIAFPLTYFTYAAERAALPPWLLAAHSPPSVHAPLSLAHLGMYGLMLQWGKTLLLGGS